MMLICGVDPGGSGALALLDGVELVSVADMPTFEVKRGTGMKKELDVHELVRLLNAWEPSVCFFERVGGMQGDSPSSAFNFGRIAGMCEAIVKASGARFEFTSPHIWKREMGLIHKDKDDARLAATNRWPQHAEKFKRKMDDGRAEAAQIAEYGRRQMVKEGIFS